MSKYKGNIISATQTVLSGTSYTGKANGKFTLSEQIQARGSSLWAKGINVSSAPVISNVARGNTTANVTLSVADTGGQPITAYNVTTSPSGTVTTGASSPVTVTGLTNSQTYTFTATATNASGTSAVSSSVQSTGVPTVIGEAFGGGYYAGKINENGIIYYLIVAPKATGNASSLRWSDNGAWYTNVGATSLFDGAANTTKLVNASTDYTAAAFCKNLTIGGFTDWYLPAKNELEVLYYFLKPSTTANYTTTSVGANANAVSPEPTNTNYTASVPARTSAVLFNEGGAESMNAGGYAYATSTEATANAVWYQNFSNGQQFSYVKYQYPDVRAIRKIPV